MEVKKAKLVKQIETEGGEHIEVLDLRIQLGIEDGDSYEDMRSTLHKKLDQRFNALFAAELGLMEDRIAEGERWKQQGMFEAL